MQLLRLQRIRCRDERRARATADPRCKCWFCSCVCAHKHVRHSCPRAHADGRDLKAGATFLLDEFLEAPGSIVATALRSENLRLMLFLSLPPIVDVDGFRRCHRDTFCALRAVSTSCGHALVPLGTPFPSQLRRFLGELSRYRPHRHIFAAADTAAAAILLEGNRPGELC